ncbi:MAG: cofactor-independent phosphoglycerate mutase [bacterium]|jgi:2,3-bisphosphoglycerate-independent phosphoglycerate mutase|nr:cofactor-independent phosphoglycerate mutase [bacterium]MDD3805149.1 cofactor-independent phosphoglycerate mutase [bacterium]MDD4152530.1 cofactor-independent phosphoglycerate mutase [bacterium]MDD4558134.1 cofactor-independent phosphoglycerate mutase [bacterium]
MRNLKPITAAQRYIVIVGDGMADHPVPELGGRTPLEAAATPCMDLMAAEGCCGQVQTVPAGMPPGSDVANLSLLGYDPAAAYTGRGPLEAAALGVTLGPEDYAYRCNLVTLADGMLEDYSVGHIDSAAAGEIIDLLQKELCSKEISLHKGTAYRHLLTWRNGKALQTVPPHDIQGCPFAEYLPQGDDADIIIHLMERSREILASSDINRRRAAAGLKLAGSIWPWGGGKAPAIAPFAKKYGLSGAVITAVDLIRGLGIYAGMRIIEVPGATGYIDTDYAAKADYALAALDEADFVFLHVEAPDEAAHAGLLREKIRAIESIDSQILAPLIGRAGKDGALRLLLLPDHATPMDIRTHSSEPVPFAIFPASRAGGNIYTEKAAAAGPLIGSGAELLDFFISRRA